MSLRLNLTRLVLIAVLLSAGCGRTPEPNTAHFRYSMGEAPRSFDPLQAASEYEAAAVLLIFDSPYRYRLLARPYQLAPLAAATLPEVDASGTVYTVRLRDDLRFQDHPAFPNGQGRSVEAADLAYSLKRHFDPALRSRGAWLWQDRLRGVKEWVAGGANYDQPLSGIEVLDRHTLRLHLQEPDPTFPYSLTQAFAAIVPREVVEALGPDFGVRPIGSGPYRFVSFDGQKLELTAHRDYRMPAFDLGQEGYAPGEHEALGIAALAGRAPPLLDALSIYYLPDEQSRWSAFEQDALDFAALPATHRARVLSQVEPPRLASAYANRWQLRVAASTEALFYNFNMQDPQLGAHPDPREHARRRALRCAIALSYDWQARRDRFHGGLGAVFGGVIPPGSLQFDAEFSARHVRRDLERARALLREHGWTRELLPTLRLGSVAGLEHQQMFELFRGFLLELGYPAERIEWRPYPSFDAYVEALNAGQVMLQDLGWALDTPDALSILQLYYGPYAAPQVNSANYRDAEFDRWFEEARRLPYGAEREQRIGWMNAKLTEDCVAISGLSRIQVLLWDRRFVLFPDRDLGSAHFLRFAAPRVHTATP